MYAILFYINLLAWSNIGEPVYGLDDFKSLF